MKWWTHSVTYVEFALPNLSTGIYGPKCTKFSTLVKHTRVCLPWKFDRGYSRRENPPKTWNFHTCTRKSAHHVYIQRSEVKVKRTSSWPFSSGSTAILRVQKFASVAKLSAPNCRHRSQFFSFSPQNFVWKVSPHLGPAFINYTNFQSAAKSVDWWPRLCWRKWRNKKSQAKNITAFHITSGWL